MEGGPTRAGVESCNSAVFTSYLQSYKKAKLPMPSGDISYGNFVLFVKVNGQFDACATAVLSLGKPMALKGHYILSF